MHQHENLRAVKGGVNGVVANSATPLSMAWLPTAPPAKDRTKSKRGSITGIFKIWGVVWEFCTILSPIW
jgi:hypothetical protein